MNSGNSLKVVNHCCHLKVKTARPTATPVVLRTQKHWVQYSFQTTAPHTSQAAKEGSALCGHGGDTGAMVWVWVQPAEKGAQRKGFTGTDEGAWVSLVRGFVVMRGDGPWSRRTPSLSVTSVFG